MSKTEVINLDKLISKMIHHPRVQGMPLYTRVDGQLEEGVMSVRDSNKSVVWLEASKRSYSSPDNIRRIFITHRAVYVHLYRPVIGTKNTSLRRETTFSKDFAEVRNSIEQSRAMGMLPEYVVRQTGLGALCRPWVCSNVEEVYFDWTIFLSMDASNMGMGDLLSYYMQTSSGMASNEPIVKLFEIACLKGIKNMRDRFPRLRAIGYIQHLEDIYTRIKEQPGKESLEDMMKPWYKNALVKQAIESSNTGVAIKEFTDIPVLNPNYSLKDGIYVFDRDVLKDYFVGLETRIKDYYREQRNKALDQKKEELIKEVQTTKSRFEISIDNIYAEEGPEKALLALRLSLDGLSREEKMAMLNNMSAEGQARYKKLLGIAE